MADWNIMASCRYMPEAGMVETSAGLQASPGPKSNYNIKFRILIKNHYNRADKMICLFKKIS
jgi:hypothetical protein